MSWLWKTTENFRNGTEKNSMAMASSCRTGLPSDPGWTLKTLIPSSIQKTKSENDPDDDSALSHARNKLVKIDWMPIYDWPKIIQSNRNPTALPVAGSSLMNIMILPNNGKSKAARANAWAAFVYVIPSRKNVSRRLSYRQWLWDHLR